MVLAVEDGEIVFEAVNGAFRLSGMGIVAAQSPISRDLGNRIRAFVASDAAKASFCWELGEAVDCRYYRVTLARRPGKRHEPRCILTLVDQTAEQRTEHSLRREMLYDSLTGLPNRAGFGDLIENRLDAENRGYHAVLAINLDRFSRINACLGALSGDELLISVARRLKGALRGGDFLARTGGDEFAVLMRLDDGPDDAMRVTRRIEGALTTPFRLSDFEIRVECSIGVAYGDDVEDDAEDMIRHAQFAVKRAKQTGRIEIYQSRVFDVARRQFSVETQLRHAIERGGLNLMFQPIWDLATGRVVSFESLARWQRDDGVNMSPTEFIAVAEESGLIVPLGRWAMEEAARTLCVWDSQCDNTDVRLGVNISAIQLQRDHISTMVRDVLQRRNLSGERFTLELTESAIISDPDHVEQTMGELREIGVTLAMDDFGTGYSNLAYLQRLPIDLLKIDRSFVTGMLKDRDKIAIVRAILSLSQALGMQTVAEGVESNELGQTLAALGCNYGQGFLYSPALPADQAFELLVRRNSLSTTVSASASTCDEPGNPSATH